MPGGLVRAEDAFLCASSGRFEALELPSTEAEDEIYP